MLLADGQPVVFVAQPELAPERAAEGTGFVYARPDDIADTGRTWREELVAYNQQHNPDVADILLGRHLRGDSGGRNIDLSHPTDRLKPVDGLTASAANRSSNDYASLSANRSASNTRSPSTAINPLGLLPAWQLYKNKTYRLLADTLGPRNFYVFSAGWGLVRSDFMIPNYDFTLSPNATGPDKYKRRRKDDTYDDFAMLPIAPTDTGQSDSSGRDALKSLESPAQKIDPAKSGTTAAGPVVFLGSKAYVPLFCQLTEGCSAHRIVFHNSKTPPEAPDCEIRKYDTPKKTDWHYDAAKALVEGQLNL